MSKGSLRHMVVVLFLLAVLLPSAFAYFNTSLNLSQFKVTYHFAVNITKSATHKANFTTPFNAKGNFTIKISKPLVLQGVTPNIARSKDLMLDYVRHKGGNVTMNPATCENHIAYCYRVFEHEQNRTTFGKNYTAVSSYLLPTERINEFVCLANDSECLRSATSCYCPTQKIPPPPVLYETGQCDSKKHLCLAGYSNFVMCTANLTTCKATYPACGCGPTNTCASTKNACINTRDQLVLCSGSLPDCAAKFKTCYCGPDMMALQQGCTTYTHVCVKNNRTSICTGKLVACALDFDKCTC